MMVEKMERYEAMKGLLRVSKLRREAWMGAQTAQHSVDS